MCPDLRSALEFRRRPADNTSADRTS